MNKVTILLASAGLAMLSASGHAQSATGLSSEYVTGTIVGAQTKDYLGLFGTAGADLAGKTITIYAQYVYAPFGPATQNCGSNCASAYTLTGTNRAGAVTISVKVNNVEHVYVPASEGIVQSNGRTNGLYIGADPAPPYGLTGANVNIIYTSNPKLGSSLTGNAPVLDNSGKDYTQLFTATGGGEQLNFAVTSVLAQ